MSIGLLVLAGLGFRALVLRLCPRDRPELPTASWIVPVEAVATGLFTDVTLAAMGDVDGDGIGDVVVGIPLPAEGPSRIHLLSGRDGKRLRTWSEREASVSGLGRHMVAVSDVDGGGLPDLATTAGASAIVLSTETGRRIFEPPGLEGHVLDVSNVGDVDGDGLVELALTFSRPRPRVEIRSGSRGTLLHAITSLAPDRFPVVNELDRDWVVCALGDVDGDSVDDFAIGSAPGWRSDEPLSTRHIGLVGAISGRTGAELWVEPGDFDHDRWPSALAPLPDRDGDGAQDLALGAHGRIELRSGRTGTLLAQADGPPRTDWGEFLRAAGDVDGDGTTDLLVVCTNPNTRSGKPFPTGGYFELLSGVDLSAVHQAPLQCSAGIDQILPADDGDGDSRADLVLSYPIADLSAVDFPCCDTLRTPRSWVARIRTSMPGSMVTQAPASGSDGSSDLDTGR